MKPRLINPLTILSLSILITITSCTPIIATSNITATFPPPQLTSTPTQLPPTVAPTTTQLLPTPTPYIPQPHMAVISSVYDHTCVLTSAGGVKCWGQNDYGQLGNGTIIPSSTPVDVIGLGIGVVAVEAGGSQTCVLTTAGGVKCWGLNESGELGDGTTNNSSVPVDVQGLGSGVVSLSVGGYRACAVTAAGGLKCWGSVFYGQWEQGKANHNSTPVDVPGLGSGIVAVSNGRNHICVLTAKGGVKCSGFNATGQLGDGTINDGTSTWVDVLGLATGVVAVVAGGNDTCALTSAGGLKCWGDNTWGQLGDGTSNTSSQPVDVVGLGTGVATVVVSSGHTCALTVSGGVKCWGSNQNGVLGDGTTETRYTPVDVVGLHSGVTAIAAGGDFTCALTASGALKCWGENRVGQLGDGLPSTCVTPVDVMGMSNGISALSVGRADACAQMATGELKCWGPQFVTHGPTSGRSMPVTLAQLGEESKLLTVGSAYDICVLAASGSLKCLDSDRKFVEVAGFENGVKSVSAGGFHICAVNTSGGVKCWGDTEYGGLGDGTTDSSSTPVDVVSLDSGASAVSVGFSHACALMDSGGVKCWGWNGFGQLGDGTEIDRLTPVDVSGLGSGVTAIAAGSYHTCALTASGGVKCWGQNEEGQLGNGTHPLTPILTPVDVVGLNSDVIAITAGEHHTCALTASGEVDCWGNNLYGQLGDGTLADHWTPQAVTGLESGVVAVDAGLNNNCVLTASGGVKCWGDDFVGQIGDGRLLWSYLPVDVVGWSSQAAP